MTYRELLKLYKQGKLEDSAKKQVEAEIEKQDAISEFLYEEGTIPDFSDLESGQERFDDSNDENQLTERQDNKAEDNVEKQSKNQIIEKSKSAGDSRVQQTIHKRNPAFYPQSLYQNGTGSRSSSPRSCFVCGVYFTKGGVKILLRSKRSCRKI